ncbi:MAG: chemotaxis protein CheW [Colwellia sp.]|nr:chemotaxis protein CheW [Colwellia sp.]MCW8864374.1 chemotaxis protein CheW [Colwellia sp.]MCW9081093.1 chemotaxis protein CheW [Colwellia sp.]
MAKSLAASNKVMKNYLSELLTEEAPELEKKETKTVSKVADVIENNALETLLQNVNAELDIASNKVSTDKGLAQQESLKDKKAQPRQAEAALTTHKSSGDFIAKTPKNYRQGNFQALFFDVAGLTIAVPLIELGGIHKVTKTTSLMGKPDWFQGVMLHRDEKINVVDTALWVMPEKCDEALKSSLNYQYVIMLSDSRWGLMAEHLVDTVILKQDEVKWLDSPSKRPWLAGLVKDRMCALLDVDSLITLLNEGSGINQHD